MRMEDRFKDYESIMNITLPRRAFTIVRVDGRAFHTYTQRLARPFSRPLATAMDAAAKALCQEISGSVFAYVQSDEISVLFSDRMNDTSQAWFGGSVQKIVSVTASIATAVFNRAMHDLHIEPTRSPLSVVPSLAQFDSRVFTVPDREEAVNYFLWRQRDAERNSIMMAARSLYSHNALQNTHTGDLKQKLIDHGIPWESHEARFRRGGMVVKVSGDREVTFTDKRTNEEQTIVVERSWWENHPADIFGFATLTEKLFSSTAPVAS